MELFDLIYKYKIKLYIISGGLLEVLENVLIEAIPIYPKLVEEKLITIISNELEYNSDSISHKFKEQIVYTFNKALVHTLLTLKAFKKSL